MTDWTAWHEEYDDPRSPLGQRLRVVQDEIRQWLAVAPVGHLRVLSACAGLSHDVMGALEGSSRRQDVVALLVEWDGELVKRSSAALAAAGLPRVVAAQGDAGKASSLADGVPADLLLLCGVFGNVSDSDVRTTIARASSLCAQGATVIWTRHRREPDATAGIRRAWEDAGFQETEFRSPGPDSFAVGTCRLVVEPTPFDPSVRLFAFS